jgi:hypothetical protein
MAHHPLDHTPGTPELPDAWHLHTSEEGPPQVEHGGRANALVIGVALGATVIFLILTIAVIVMYFSVYTTRLRQERIESTVLSQEQLRYKLESAEKLRDYSLINPETAHQGIVSIPIDQARQTVIRRYSGRQ